MGDHAEGRLVPLGVDGVRNRVAELQARIDALGGGTPPPPPTPSAAAPQTFADALELAQNPLSGPIGKGGDDGSLRPMNPFSLGVQPTQSKEDLRSLAAVTAQRHGLDPKLFEALIEQESGFNPLARSRVGALGLTQLMPQTAADLGVTDPTDPAQNLDGGARYLAEMLRKFGNDPRLALAAYNAGPGAVTRYGGVPPYAETRNYVERILAKVATGSP